MIILIGGASCTGKTLMRSEESVLKTRQGILRLNRIMKLRFPWHMITLETGWAKSTYLTQP